MLSKDLLGDAARFLKENVTVGLLTFEGQPIEVKLPTTVDLKVTETAPGYKAATASGGGKPATLETGVVITVTFFVSVGRGTRGYARWIVCDAGVSTFLIRDGFDRALFFWATSASQ